MDQYVTGNTIRMLREKNKMTQAERIEDEYFVTVSHDMTKDHYVSFIAALSSDTVQMVKLYPEWNAEARFRIRGVKEIVFYCNRDGLFCQKL